METTHLLKEIASLPTEAQKQIIDFIAFLKTRYPAPQIVKKTKQLKLVDEPFIGMWRGREDMQDSTAWVRNLRRREWEQNL
ncbi:DUF2281 domain-containing protein [Candidatus Poribacteria bacterium]|nr:DUF2281 domain-containing protein [Candidatus Poribacteria bacterium]